MEELSLCEPSRPGRPKENMCISIFIIDCLKYVSSNGASVVCVWTHVILWSQGRASQSSNLSKPWIAQPPSHFLATPNTNHPKQRPNLKERSGLYIGALSNSSFYECNSMWMMCDFMFFKQRLYLTLFSCFCLWSRPAGPVHLDRWCSTSTCSNAF